MKRHSFAVSLVLGSGAALLIALALGGSSGSKLRADPPAQIPRTRLVVGDADLVEGNLVVTWARIRDNGNIKEVGVTIPVALFDNQPTEEGDGPAGAIASLVFPQVVRETTYFNHFEMHTEPDGHVTAPGAANPDQNRVPHFDFHFYAIDEELVWDIPATTAPPRPIPVAAPLLPVGYIQPGTSIAEMGRHAGPLSAFLDPNFLTKVMIAGFTVPGDQMHFIEPMASREFLMQRTSFELPVPRPAVFGRTMRYPTEFVAEYDADGDVYHFIFSGFETVE